MTEELKPHQIAQLVNKLRDIATKYHAHGCLRELISREVNAALTQRPAAQTEREAFEAWADANVQSDYSKSDRHCMWWGWQARASLPAQPAAQDEREADEVFLPRRLAATQKLTQLGYRYDSAHGKWLPAPQQATPEPVGDVRCEGCGYMTHHREHMGCVRAAKQHTHPAPDGWTEADADAARLAMELECLLLDTKDTAVVSRWWKSANEAIDLHRARLAAAQAKGADK